MDSGREDSERRRRAAEDMARRWVSDDELVQECPVCGTINDSHARRCACGWDLGRRDGDQVRRRIRLQRIGGSILAVVVGVGASVLLSAADGGSVWIYYGAILTGLAGLAGGLWFAFFGPGRKPRGSGGGDAGGRSL